MCARSLQGRVATRFEQVCDLGIEFNLHNAPCHVSGIRRTIWDGSRKLGEIQVPTVALENDYHVGQRDFTTGLNLERWVRSAAG